MWWTSTESQHYNADSREVHHIFIDWLSLHISLIDIHIDESLLYWKGLGSMFSDDWYHSTHFSLYNKHWQNRRYQSIDTKNWSRQLYSWCGYQIHVELHNQTLSSVEGINQIESCKLCCCCCCCCCWMNYCLESFVHSVRDSLFTLFTSNNI
jgi:hypothetical protein